jgi:DNA repair protein RadC
MTEQSNRAFRVFPVVRISDLPSEERPRERLSRLGPAALSNEELLALLLRTGIPGESALDRARSLLATRGGLAGLAGSAPEELAAERGIGPTRASAIVAAIEIARRLPAASLAGRDLLNDPRLVKDYLRSAQADGGQERTGALYLNARNRLLKNDPEIYRGTLDRAVVEPREILRRALLGNAAAVILYHNHPSGDPTPSREDREFTRRLATAAEAVGVRLLDHIVVGREGCVSFRESGLL